MSEKCGTKPKETEENKKNMRLKSPPGSLRLVHHSSTSAIHRCTCRQVVQQLVLMPNHVCNVKDITDMVRQCETWSDNVKGGLDMGVNTCQLHRQSTGQQ